MTARDCWHDGSIWRLASPGCFTRLCDELQANAALEPGTEAIFHRTFERAAAPRRKRHVDGKPASLRAHRTPRTVSEIPEPNCKAPAGPRCTSGCAKSGTNRSRRVIVEVPMVRAYPSPQRRNPSRTRATDRPRRKRNEPADVKGVTRAGGPEQ
jgi:hypothetical protein